MKMRCFGGKACSSKESRFYPAGQGADLVALCRYLCTGAGAAVGGATLRAYG
ncbi:hypothetical protein GQ464_013255 [Rhodocaloribacter litoris]|uniref:hypothetical protein n=1 Tax=Rhodocaloribacter litoris TaxID=2558931 RepID=UPI0014213D78|nr:hypothetical protein [Rhodocaloribacter litoris]QXD14399.1 hypothetical protein GQ464_013255 [Rhodocaloribacter litoris]